MSPNPISKWFRIILPALACLAVVTGSPRAAAAQAAPEAPAAAEATVKVGRVAVSGNVVTDSTRILRTFDIHPGTLYSQDQVKRGTKKLFALGLFSDVKVLRTEHDDVIDLTVVVRERPRLASVAFSGNKKRDQSDLEKKLFLRAGETYSASQVQMQVDSLLLYYRDEGYPRAKVTPALDTLAANAGLALTFRIDEGEKLRITRIRFEGASAFPAGKLRKNLKTKTKGFFGGGELKDETWVEDREKLEGFYHDHGYRDMQAVDFTTEPGAEPRALTLVVRVDEGRRYRFGEISFSGNQVVKSEQLRKSWTAKPKAVYNKTSVERANGEMYGEYAEHGYLTLRIEPRETVRDSLVDLEFAVTEGQPSHVRLVSFTGNKGTRENVLRREVDIHEGDLFRKSALVRSRDDLMRLGLFEEVNFDFAEAESSDVNLSFKVKEKQVGTASAGAGYTSQTGMTGFLEVSHNNVLGNGQQLSLHLERGSNVENYTMGFTEPWFRDSPTLLGYSVYSTKNLLTSYDEWRRGGSVRIGRPLPWPDYSRGSLSYTLEKMKIDSLSNGLYFSGVPIGHFQVTSSLESNFSRNSADSPFYPTHGTRLTASDLFAGGPFGGEVNYTSHRYEGRAWAPSLVKRMTSMVRLRVGTVNVYPWKHNAVPDYARFRLGGGSTLDPLRGYDDYQVVPDKFISQITTIGRIDTLWTDTTRTAYTSIDTTRVKSTRRWPGGRYMVLFSFEQQFPIVHPLHGLIFFDAGNTWDQRREIKPFKLKTSVGFGFRMEIPILGNVGFDYGYGFNRDDGARWKGDFLLGNVGF